MKTFKTWLFEVNLTLSQFMKRVSSNLKNFYQKIYDGELFETEQGTPIKLSGLAIKEKDKKPIVYLVKRFTKDNWVSSIQSFIEDPDFEAINNLFIVLDDGHITPTLKPIGILSKTVEFGSRGTSMKQMEIPDSAWRSFS